VATRVCEWTSGTRSADDLRDGALSGGLIQLRHALVVDVDWQAQEFATFECGRSVAILSQSMVDTWE
jgi:hypothetical protein